MDRELHRRGQHRHTAGQGGGLANTGPGRPRVDNCIFWGNGPNPVAQVQLNLILVDPPELANCDVEGGFFGPGNFSSAPRFVNPAAGDYRLRGDSPCVDAGSSTATYVSTSDLDGDPRPTYSGIDVGADELVDVSRHPAAAGNLGPGVWGLPERALRVDGRHGGRARRVDVPAGTPLVVSMLAPRRARGPHASRSTASSARRRSPT